MFSEKKVKKTKKEITFLFEIEVKQHKFSLFQALFMDFYKNPNMETKTLNSKYLGYIYICMYITSVSYSDSWLLPFVFHIKFE